MSTSPNSKPAQIWMKSPRCVIRSASSLPLTYYCRSLLLPLDGDKHRIFSAYFVNGVFFNQSKRLQQCCYIVVALFIQRGNLLYRLDSNIKGNFAATKVELSDLLKDIQAPHTPNPMCRI